MLLHFVLYRLAPRLALIMLQIFAIILFSNSLILLLLFPQFSAIILILFSSCRNYLLLYCFRRESSEGTEADSDSLTPELELEADIEGVADIDMSILTIAI